jgi:hypothetical protein
MEAGVADYARTLEEVVSLRSSKLAGEVERKLFEAPEIVSSNPGDPNIYYHLLYAARAKTGSIAM